MGKKILIIILLTLFIIPLTNAYSTNWIQQKSGTSYSMNVNDTTLAYDIGSNIIAVYTGTDNTRNVTGVFDPIQFTQHSAPHMGTNYEYVELVNYTDAELVNIRTGTSTLHKTNGLGVSFNTYSQIIFGTGDYYLGYNATGAATPCTLFIMNNTFGIDPTAATVTGSVGSSHICGGSFRSYKVNDTHLLIVHNKVSEHMGFEIIKVGGSTATLQSELSVTTSAWVADGGSYCSFYNDDNKPQVTCITPPTGEMLTWNVNPNTITVQDNHLTLNNGTELSYKYHFPAGYSNSKAVPYLMNDSTTLFIKAGVVIDELPAGLFPQLSFGQPLLYDMAMTDIGYFVLTNDNATTYVVTGYDNVSHVTPSFNSYVGNETDIENLPCDIGTGSGCYNDTSLDDYNLMLNNEHTKTIVDPTWFKILVSEPTSYTPLVSAYCGTETINARSQVFNAAIGTIAYNTPSQTNLNYFNLDDYNANRSAIENVTYDYFAHADFQAINPSNPYENIFLLSEGNPYSLSNEYMKFDGNLWNSQRTALYADSNNVDWLTTGYTIFDLPVTTIQGWDLYGGFRAQDWGGLSIDLLSASGDYIATIHIRDIYYNDTHRENSIAINKQNLCTTSGYYCAEDEKVYYTNGTVNPKFNEPFYYIISMSGSTLTGEIGGYGIDTITFTIHNMVNNNPPKQIRVYPLPTTHDSGDGTVKLYSLSYWTNRLSLGWYNNIRENYGEINDSVYMYAFSCDYADKPREEYKVRVYVSNELLNDFNNYEDYYIKYDEKLAAAAGYAEIINYSAVEQQQAAQKKEIEDSFCQLIGVCTEGWRMLIAVIIMAFFTIWTAVALKSNFENTPAVAVVTMGVYSLFFVLFAAIGWLPVWFIVANVVMVAGGFGLMASSPFRGGARG